MKWNSNKNAQADGGDRTGEKARTVGKIRGGRSQSFFESGGDSLSATRFLAEIKKKYSVDIPLKDIFSTPSLKSVADLLQARLAENEGMVEGEI